MPAFSGPIHILGAFPGDPDIKESTVQIRDSCIAPLWGDGAVNTKVSSFHPAEVTQDSDSQPPMSGTAQALARYPRVSRSPPWLTREPGKTVVWSREAQFPRKNWGIWSAIGHRHQGGRMSFPKWHSLPMPCLHCCWNCWMSSPHRGSLLPTGGILGPLYYWRVALSPVHLAQFIIWTSSGYFPWSQFLRGKLQSSPA